MTAFLRSTPDQSRSQYASKLLLSLIWLALTMLLSTGVSRAEIKQSQLEELAKNEQWLHLLHYHKVGLFSSMESQADDPEFFLSPNGNTDPFAELLASVKALTADPQLQCRFPARAHWLKQQLPGHLPEANECPDYEKWYQEIAPEGLTLVFPAAYLNSPSSMFGHTLIRIDSSRHNNPLLDYSVNYAANADPDDNELVFSYKGLTGGYPGVFSVLPYDEKVKEYSHLEARDVWEYRIDINSDELDQFLRHVWEIKDTHFDYYFFTENCSYHLLTLLDAASERFDLSDEFYSDVIPADTVRVLNQAGLINEAVFRPSSLSQMKSMQSQMSDTQIEMAKNRIETALLAEPTDSGTELSDVESAQMLDLAYLYGRYLANKGKHDNKLLARNSLRLLSERSKNPETVVFEPLKAPATRDDQGHRSHRVQLAGGRAFDQNFAQFGLRMAYHDWLDTLAGYIPGAQLEIAHIKLRSWLGDNSSAQVEEIRFIDIASLTPRDMFFKPWSWFVSTGLERPHSEPDELSPYLNGGAGLSFSANPLERHAQLVSVLLESEVIADNDIDKGYRFAMGPKLVWLNQHEHWSMTLSASKLYDLAGADFDYASVQLGISKRVHQNWQVRLENEYAEFRSKDDASDRTLSNTLSLMYYF